MHQIVFLNRFFYPDHSATSQILSDLAIFLSERGEKVLVITSRSRYDACNVVLPKCERYRGVEIYRAATTHFGRGWLPGRAVDYLSFYLTACWSLLRLTRRGDVVVVKTDPPLMSVLVAPLARLRGLRMVNWLQDLYPEIAGELGISILKKAPGRLLAWLRDVSLRASQLSIVIGEDMARRLWAREISADRIVVAPNWADDDVIRPVPHGDNPLRAECGLTDKFVVAYSGNLGRAHEVETLLGAARLLADRTDIVFLFVGGGHGVKQVQSHVREAGLTNFLFKPYQPREALAQSLCAGDVHWLSLKLGLDGLLLPSKFYGIIAAGRPVIVIGSADGELSRLVRESGCGTSAEIGQAADLAEAILRLADDPACCGAMGRKARQLSEARFAKFMALERWHEILRSVAVPAATSAQRGADEYS